MIELVFPIPPSENRRLKHTRRGVYLSQEARDYKQIAAILARDVDMLKAEVAVSLYIYRPAKRGDIDNYLKALLDSLQGTVYRNDNQIKELHIYLRDDKINPRVVIKVQSLDEVQSESHLSRENETPGTVGSRSVQPRN